MNNEDNKYALRRDTVKYQQALEKELDKWVGSAKSTVRNILIMGGTLTVSYLVVRRIAKTKHKKEKKSLDVSEGKLKSEQESSLFDQISAFVMNELSIYLLLYAKEKILEYIETLKDEDE